MVESHRGALESLQRTATAHQVGTVHGSGSPLGLVQIDEGRVALVGTVQLIQSESLRILVSRLVRQPVSPAGVTNLRLMAGHVLRKVIDGLVYLPIQPLKILVLSGYRQSRQRQE